MTNWIKKTKPTWLLMIPNFKTLGLVYVLLMLFLARHSISLFIINKLDRYLLPISNFLSTNLKKNGITKINVFLLNINIFGNLLIYLLIRFLIFLITLLILLNIDIKITTI